MGKRFSKSLGRRTHSKTEARISTLDEDEALALLDSFEEDPFLLVLDQVQDPRNLGACLRSADGAGVNLVIIPSDRSVGITDVVRHVASGAAEALPIARVRNLSRFMKELQDRGVRLVGTSDQAKSTIFESNLKGSLGLIVGAEETGIRRLTAENCDQLIKIPMRGTIECLNVSVATGVCLFEAFRQRMPLN
ncbi:MAG: 23S rRNA (guanosine(2251)-2'-O)-methyltransferase RlmB [Opitutae bacterium]|jgi:23S rRNA (guanosine2251-2'-O)-methyltransferase|nr:23S rRNA (guanosine(2251)-2'-O)-methyltransferase RlmB [Opitutae bacterium]MBT5717352.1 23S rRNA (guanosine(2251)-2'-O)-methyltransferase RlmB [Opitutae bacterium]